MVPGLKNGFSEKEEPQMKKLFFVVSGLAALALLAPSAGFAQTNNQFGIYTDAGGQSASIFEAVPNAPFGAYLVLTNPVNETYDGGTGTTVPVTMVEAFECRIIMPASASFFALTTTLPPESIDIGQKPDFVVGSATPYPVTDNAVVLITWTMMVTDLATHNFFLEMTSIPSLPGTMAFQDAGGDPDGFPLVEAYPASGNSSDAVFSINGGAVAIENESWGNVKSLYR
jgi:hypothetical protein